MRRKALLAAAAAQIMGMAMFVGSSAAQVMPVTASTVCADATVIPVDAPTAQAAGDSVLCLLNVERAKRGIKAVAMSRTLVRASVASSADMVRLKYFAHVSPDGMTLRKRAAAAGYRTVGTRKLACPPSLGEVLAFGSGEFSSPSQLVQSLMADPSHRSVILDRRYRDAGIGVALGAPLDGMGDGVTVAISFGRR